MIKLTCLYNADGEVVGWWSQERVGVYGGPRFLINKYRRPDKPNRDADLGGPTDAAGVLYVLKIKAPR